MHAYLYLMQMDNWIFKERIIVLFTPVYYVILLEILKRMKLHVKKISANIIGDVK